MPVIANKLPDLDILRSRYFYKDGLLISRKKEIPVGSFTYDGYLKVNIKGKQQRVHRIIWALHYGDIPRDVQIDHIDRNRSNNNIENLRLATHSQNMRNMKVRTKSGVCGVYWCKRENLWYAVFTTNKVSKKLGKRKDFFEAVCLRKSAEAKFHVNEENSGTRKTRDDQ